MITKLNTLIPSTYLLQAQNSLIALDSKMAINEPTGDFFYDPWVIKDEFKESIWHKILQTLPAEPGEARLINLGIERCYTKHADIDNRWHFSLASRDSYLIDLDLNKMHSLAPGEWYYMDAGRLHSAVNFGCDDRVSLVVRERLSRVTLQNPKQVSITPDPNIYNYRFIFDEIYSTLMNKWQCRKVLTDFEVEKNKVTFKLEKGIEIPKYTGFYIEEHD